MLTKTDIKNLILELKKVFVTKDDLDVVHTDLKIVKMDLKGLTKKVEEIDKRDLADSNMLSKIYLDHERRIGILEKAAK